ncbi:MAG: hypothetical protein LWX83_08385 [Anaerolineae bacterium]|nr:hypothetical protein [Anaerolineae bacterium]
MNETTGKSIVKPLLYTALALAVVMACFLLVFLSATLGTAYSVSNWLTSTPNVSELIYRTSTDNAVAVVLPTETMLQETPLPSATQPEIPTEVIEPTATETPEEIETAIPSSTPTETPLPATPTTDFMVMTQTQQAQEAVLAGDMQTLVQNLYDNQTIKKKEGTYFHMPDFEGEWNEPGNYQFSDTNMALSDFVLQADMNWQVDGNQGEWAESGCGVVFRADEMGNYYMIYLSLDGRGRLVRKLNGSSVMLGRSTIYDVDRNDGNARFMLIVEGDRVRYYVNDKIKFDKYVQPQIGKLAWTIVSGNKKGFGTYCKISNINIWKLSN